MLLVHQTGSVKLGEVVRYTPSQDRIVPTSPHLCVKVRNTSAIALRAAYLHGPYTLYAACYPTTFDPNDPRGSPEDYGYPQFEPNLKAGGSWNAQIKVPEDIRETFVASDNRRHSAKIGGSVTWVVEICSQTLFSANAGVHYEILVGRDEKSIDLGFAGAGGVSHAAPGVLSDFQNRRKETRPDLPQSKGVYTRAIQLTISDTAAIWNTPQLPGQDLEQNDRDKCKKNPVLDDPDPTSPTRIDYGENEIQNLGSRKSTQKDERQKIHLVLITHGLHGNLGADMLYLKESIDAAAKKARIDRKMRRAKETSPNQTKKIDDESYINQNDRRPASPSSSEKQESPNLAGEFDDNGDEQVIVRGFPGNAVRTERGIKYLGKRLAKYVLAMTYPDQPYIPVKKKSMTRHLTSAFGGSDKATSPVEEGHLAHQNSTIRKEPMKETGLAYQISSISFIGHSLGGLVQTYAIAYIQKHSPEFFDLIKPINFVALASPFLGLSNENPLYVKFALDFGLVGRTGQDLGLTWRPPTMVRSGWGAMIAGIGSEGQRRKSQMEPGSKPLLRILPSGPAHQVLRRFRNRTVYSNVVNDGIVPLRTSCLLFLDWQGLGRVEKARRENGLVGTMAGWGWAEITGQNSTEQQQAFRPRGSDQEGSEDEEDQNNISNSRNQPGATSTATTVPQPDDEDIADHPNVSAPSSPIEERRASFRVKEPSESETVSRRARSNSDSGSSPFSGFLAMLRPGSGSHNKSHSPQRNPKSNRIYKRSQTIKFSDDDSSATPSSRDQTPDTRSPTRPGIARGESALNDQSVIAPPKTSVFESAGDILNPPLPTREYLTDPASRPRTIFHDRVYHPEAIPPPAVRQRSFFHRSNNQEGRASTQTSLGSVDTTSSVGSSGSSSHMKPEEKIARAYHRDLSWRKVLVRLEPDAHNNIVVRRMFANAYGWPVVKHLVDTHFADSAAAILPDNYEAGLERAKPMHALSGSAEVTEPVRRTSQSAEPRPATNVTTDEQRDAVSDLPDMTSSYHSGFSTQSRLSRQDSAQWDDRFFESDDDDDDEDAFEATRSPRHVAMENVSKLMDSRGGKRRHSGEHTEEYPQESTGGDGPKSERESGLSLNALKKPMVLPDPEVSPVGSTTSDVGLRKSIEAQMHARDTRGR